MYRSVVARTRFTPARPPSPVAFESLEGRQLLSAAHPSQSVQAQTHVASVATVSPAKSHTTSGVTISGTGNVTALPDNQVTPQIAVNPTDANNLVAVSMTDDNGGNTVVVSNSFDGGVTWNVSRLGGSQDGFDQATPRVDGRVAFDAFGNLYVAYMVATSGGAIDIVVATSTNGGQSFDNVTTAVGGAGSNADNPSLATGIDSANPNNQAVWISYTDQNTDRINIVHAISTGLGSLGSFSGPEVVSDSAGAASNTAVGPYGSVVVAWQTGGTFTAPGDIYAASDPSGSLGSFGANVLITPTNVGDQYPVPAQPTRTIDAEPKLAFDRSGGRFNGRLYLVYTDAASAGSADTNIFLRTSDNLGASWGNALRVNDDSTGRSQILPALAVDSSTGFIGVSWLDARADRHNRYVREYAALSIHGGASFGVNLPVGAGYSNTSFGTRVVNSISGDLDLGDSTGLAFAQGRLVPVWADNSNVTRDNPDGTQNTFDVSSAVVTIR